MSDAHHLDPTQARTNFEHSVITLRNQQRSWRQIAERLDCSQRICRDAWARANAHQRGGTQTAGPVREVGTIGNEQLLRGIPLFADGVRIGGTIRGTDPERETLHRLDRQQREHARRPYKRAAL